MKELVVALLVFVASSSAYAKKGDKYVAKDPRYGLTFTYTENENGSYTVTGEDGFVVTTQQSSLPASAKPKDGFKEGPDGQGDYRNGSGLKSAGAKGNKKK